MRKGQWRTVVAVCIACVAVVARVIIAYKTPVCPNTYAGIDDALFIDHAGFLWRGGWLGPYGEMTLAKNPGYSLVMAAFRLLGLRYQLGFALLLVLVCAVAARSLRPLVPSRPIRLVLFVALLYLPMFFTDTFFQRVYRNGVAALFALLLFSSYVGLYLRRRERLPIVLAWSLLSGLSLGIFSTIQESASWALPFVVVCTLVMLGLTIRDIVSGERRCEDRGHRPKHMGKPCRSQRTGLRMAARLALFVLPVLVYACTLAGISGINRSHYGVFLLNDKYQGEFARATANIMSIDVGFRDQRVWVCAEALNKALEAARP